MAINTASNVGGGREVYKQLTVGNTNIEHRTLTEGSGVTVTQNTYDVTAVRSKSLKNQLVGIVGLGRRKGVDPKCLLQR